MAACICYNWTLVELKYFDAKEHGVLMCVIIEP